jgi:hypothetical protein
MKRKETLIGALRLAIDALQNGTIHYDWAEQCSCNMGVVAQAVLKVDVNELDDLRDSLFDKLAKINKERKNENKEQFDRTWKNAIQLGCPLTGERLPEIIKRLEECGMTRADMVHLEYLENPAILELSGIQKEMHSDKIQVGTEQIKVPAKGFWGWLGYTKTEEVPTYEVKETLRYPKNYYTKKENVVKYLSAWLSILLDNTMEIKYESDKHVESGLNLERELLLAVAEEDYEKAASIRDNIAKHKLSLV